MFEVDPYEKSYDKVFLTPEENGGQITKKGNRVLSTNLTLEPQNRKVEELITYSIEQ